MKRAFACCVMALGVWFGVSEFGALADQATAATPLVGRWCVLKAPGQSTLNDVMFVDAQHGWAVGVGGAIVATSDSGMTWSAQTSGTSQDLNSVWFTDALHGWAVGAAGTMLSTSDGGLNWRQAASSVHPAPPWFVRVQFLDAARGFCLGGALLATGDGGASWEQRCPLISVPGVDPYLGHTRDIFFADELHGWAVGERADPSTNLGRWGVIAATSDGGRTWHDQPPPFEGMLNAVWFRDTFTGWAVGCERVPELGNEIRTAYFETHDGGLTWRSRRLDSGLIGHAFNDVFVADDGYGWIVGDTHSTYFTSDDGATWKRTWRPTLRYATAVSVIDRAHAWMVGDHGLVLGLDTVRPTTVVPYSATVRRGRAVRLRFEVRDGIPNGGYAFVWIDIRDRNGRKRVATINAQQMGVNTPAGITYRCRLPRGTYRFYVHATDAALYTEVSTGWNRLVVR